MSLVIDCSMTLSWYFEDERTPARIGVLNQVADTGPVAPSLRRLEVLNGLQVAGGSGPFAAAGLAFCRLLYNNINCYIDTQYACRKA
jgi:hypothetical protein